MIAAAGPVDAVVAVKGLVLAAVQWSHSTAVDVPVTGAQHTHPGRTATGVPVGDMHCRHTCRRNSDNPRCPRMARGPRSSLRLPRVAGVARPWASVQAPRTWTVPPLLLSMGKPGACFAP